MRVLVAVSLLAAAAAAQQKPAYLGVGIEPLTDEVRVAYHVPADIEAGVVVREIMEKSAADRAGLRKGDVLVSFHGKQVGTRDDLVAILRTLKAGDRAAYGVRRGTGTIEGTLTLGARDEPAPEPRPEVAPETDMPRPAPVRPAGDIDSRLDKLDKTVKELREKAKAKQKTKRDAPAPRSINAWLNRERRSLAEARQARNEREIHFHEIRLGLLEELKEANLGAGGRGRLDRIEAKLDELLALLKK